MPIDPYIELKCARVLSTVCITAQMLQTASAILAVAAAALSRQILLCAPAFVAYVTPTKATKGSAWMKAGREKCNLQKALGILVRLDVKVSSVRGRSVPR